MRIVSTMGSGSLGREINLSVLVEELREYVGDSLEPSFHGESMVTVRLEDGGPAYTIYRTGTFQIRGADDEVTLKESAEKFRNVLEEIGVTIDDYSFRQATSVFGEEFGEDVDLEVLAITIGLENTEYEPEQFPALIYRPEEFEVTFLVFANGKVIIGGTKNREEASQAVGHLREKITHVIQ